MAMNVNNYVNALTYAHVISHSPSFAPCTISRNRHSWRTRKRYGLKLCASLGPLLVISFSPTKANAWLSSRHFKYSTYSFYSSIRHEKTWTFANRIWQLMLKYCWVWKRSLFVLAREEPSRRLSLSSFAFPHYLLHIMSLNRCEGTVAKPSYEAARTAAPCRWTFYMGWAVFRLIPSWCFCKGY